MKSLFQELGTNNAKRLLYWLFRKFGPGGAFGGVALAYVYQNLDFVLSLFENPALEE